MVVTAGPDTTLEIALEAVLARHGIPLFHIGPRDADRGDLASDLASAARAVGSRPDPCGYEDELRRVYETLRAAYGDHVPHGGQYGDGVSWRCGGPEANTWCNDLGDALMNVLDEAFPPEQAERWLAAPPAADWLEWGTADGQMPGDGRLRDVVADVVRTDAQDRIFPPDEPGRNHPHAYAPVDPAATRPEEAEDGG